MVAAIEAAAMADADLIMVHFPVMWGLSQPADG
jgi:hypothetical protein